MDRYIGIDVHSESCTFAVLGSSGKRLREAPVETNGKTLTDFVRGIAGKKHVCIEEGTHAEWIYELLEPLVDEIVVTIPGPKQGNKNDSNDAWQRAEELRRGTIDRAVFKAPDRFTALRAAVKAYVVTLRDMVRAKNRISALYRSRGIQAVSSDTYDPERRSLASPTSCCPTPTHGAVVDAARWPSPNTPSRDRLAARGKQESADRALAHDSTWPRHDSRSEIVATVISPHRFRTRRQFWSYCGLAIVTRSSADWTKDHGGTWVRRVVPQTRGLNHNRQPMLKNVFKGAAETVIRQMPQHPLTISYERTVAAGTRPNLAKLTLARRIAGASLAMWKNQQEYDITQQQQR